MKEVMMSDPSDLDPYGPRQIELTRKIDEEKDGGERFALFMLHNLQSVRTVAAMTAPLEAWQRGAYEANSKRDGSLEREVAAKVLWMFVHYLQEEREWALKGLKDPLIGPLVREVAAEAGLELDVEE